MTASGGLAAIANAIADATGAHVTSVPATPIVVRDGPAKSRHRLSGGIEQLSAGRP